MIYTRIRNLREDSNLTQTELGKILGMSQTGYSQYEIGKNDIPTDILKKLAVHYGTSTDYLLELTDVREPYQRRKTGK